MSYSNTNLGVAQKYTQSRKPVTSSNSIKDNLSANYAQKSVGKSPMDNKSGMTWTNSYGSRKDNNAKAKSISRNKYYVNNKTNYMGKKTYHKPSSSTNYLHEKKKYSPKRNRSNQHTPDRYLRKKV